MEKIIKYYDKEGCCNMVLEDVQNEIIIVFNYEHPYYDKYFDVRDFVNVLLNESDSIAFISCEHLNCIINELEEMEETQSELYKELKEMEKIWKC